MLSNFIDPVNLCYLYLLIFMVFNHLILKPILTVTTMAGGNKGNIRGKIVVGNNEIDIIIFVESHNSDFIPKAYNESS